MRCFCKISLVVAVFLGVAGAQSLPQPFYFGDSSQLISVAGPPPEAPHPHFAQMKALIKPQEMKSLIKTQMNRVIDGKPYPAVTEWQPLTKRQKFDVFLHSTYAPSTFLN